MWASVTDSSADLTIRHSLISPSPLNCPFCEQHNLRLSPSCSCAFSLLSATLCLFDLLKFMDFSAASQTFLFPTSTRASWDGRKRTALIRRCASSIGPAKLVGWRQQMTHKHTHTCMVGRLSCPQVGHTRRRAGRLRGRAVVTLAIWMWCEGCALSETCWESGKWSKDRAHKKSGWRILEKVTLFCMQHMSSRQTTLRVSKVAVSSAVLWCKEL